MELCKHRVTRGREGYSGDWCDACGGKVHDVDPRSCKDCAHFRDKGAGQIPICFKHLMGVSRMMHVTYKVSEGSCFSLVQDAALRGIGGAE